MKSYIKKSWRNYYLFALLTSMSLIAIQPVTNPIQASTTVDGIIKIDGSSTVYPITKAIAKGYGSTNPTVKTEVNFSGTSGGFKKFCAGQIDISNASRPITKAEMEACKKAGISYYELPIAYDALTVVVNPKNTWAKDITIAELKKIWEPQSKVTKWNQIRSEYPNQPIALFAPGQDSGTFDYFTEAINGKAKASRMDITASEDDDVLAKGVANNPNAMGYFGFSYYEKNSNNLKALGINSGNGAVMPSRADVEKAKYQPLARPLFIYVSYKSLRKAEVKSFINFYLKQASTSVATVGYIPLPSKGYELGLTRISLGRVGTVFDGKSALNLTITQLLGKKLTF